jgi:hypothetical protein
MAGTLRHPIATAGMGAFLVLAITGCAQTPVTRPATSQEEIEDTADVGAEDESGEDSLVADKEDESAYTNKAFGVAFELPHGFSVHHLDSEYDDERIDYFCCTEDGDSEATFTICSDVKKFADVTDEKSWASAFSSTYIDGMEKAGETSIQKATGTVKISDKVEGTAVKLTSTKGSVTIHRDFYFLMDDEGDGLRILLRSDDEDALETLQQSLSGTV